MEDIQEKLEKGYVHSRIIMEVVGKPKEHVEDAIKTYIGEIKKNSGIDMLNEDVAPAEEKDGMWSTFAEMEILTKDISTLTQFCFAYMPSSVEILAPERFSIRCSEMSEIFNDLQGKLHNVDMVVKKLKAENQFIRRNLNTAFKNLLRILLFETEYDLAGLSQLTGIPEKELESFLNTLIKEDIIQKKEEKYSLVEKDGGGKT